MPGLMLLTAVGCSTPGRQPAPLPTATTTVAEFGALVFTSVCSACHGERGQGLLAPALIGERASFARFGGSARAYYDYIRSNMPQNAPGSLTVDQYLAVTTYLLLQNKLVPPDAALAEDSLDSIQLPH